MADNQQLEDVGSDDIFVYTGGRAPFDVRRVRISENIDTIPANAFQGCHQLIEVEGHDKLKKIEEGAFDECISLRRLTNMGGVIEIENDAFYGCNVLLEIIGCRAFANCESLRSIDLPSIRTVGAYAFAGCKALTEAVFGEDLESLGFAFRDCTSLRRIAIPLKDEISVGNRAFTFCESLVRVDPLIGGIHKTIGKSSSSRGVIGRISLTPLHDTSLASSASSNNNNSQDDPRTLIQQGMKSFRNGDVLTSLQYFDRANNAVPDNKLTPYLWQRGISYYYLDKFQEGHEQFSLDVKVNPLDVEEIVWDIACLARMQDGGSKFPVEDQMSLPPGKKDRRKIMSTVYSLFRAENGTTEYDLREAGHNGNISDEFYSLFYLGLYCEIRGETSKAAMYMKMAERSRYATGVGSGDYMSACARVHCKLRGWV